ncbi:hypothetical protein [Sphaerisporangium corydalis]|uniref:Transposase n=1 Tax=Sphaerisporangium corydalis TaxID=1441875 RepID=A0ABV9EAI8_9ACTN|nr:hypothetical protein [Sphaerisporangium corydalis]
MELSVVADELYEGAPEDFVDRRKQAAAEAKKAGDAALAKRVGELRRPTVSAWAVNRLARAETGELARLLDLGAELRSAWAAGGHVGELDQRRGELVAGLVRMAVTLASEAGRPLREPAVREVEDTLHAATMDPAVADEVRAGWLSQPRSYAGFVPVGEPAPPGAGSAGPAVKRPAKAAGERRAGTKRDPQAEEDARRRAEEERRRRLTEQADAAAAEAREAEQALAEWDEEVERAGRARAELTAEEERLRRELKAVLDRQEVLTKRVSGAERERNRAARRAADARRHAEETRKKL